MRVHGQMKVLLAEDNLFFRSLLASNLSNWGHEVTCCEDGHEAWTLLQSAQGLDLAILDWDLPGAKVTTICSRLKQSPALNSVLVIVLVPGNHKEDLQEALDSGVDDYLIKPFDPIELRLRLRSAASILELRGRFRSGQGSDDSAGTVPSGMDILGREQVLDVLSKEMTRSERQQMPVGVIIAEIEHLAKADGTSPPPPDRTLVDAIAERMRSELRVYDSLGSYGDNILLIVVPGCNKEKARKVASRLKKSVKGIVVASGRKGFPWRVRFGVTGLVGSSRAGMEVVLKAADEALARARESSQASPDDSGPVSGGFDL
ncbi:MAG: response regulator [Thermodesulfobacteriota bacterium]